MLYQMTQFSEKIRPYIFFIQSILVHLKVNMKKTETRI